MTAQEAYEKTEDHWANLYTFEEIMKLINATILFGKFAIRFDGILMEPVAEKLRELGYEVCVNTDDPFDKYFSIDWYNVEKE